MKNTIVPLEGEKLIHTHKNLTRAFTLVVFTIVFVIGVSFVTAKYINELRIWEREFKRQSNDIYKRIELAKTFDEILPWVNGRFPGKLLFWKMRENFKSQNFVSFFILDAEKNIVFKNILEKPDFWNLSLEDIGKYMVKDGIMMSQVLLNEWERSSIVYYKKLKYSWEEALEDIILLLVMSIILSVWVYMIGSIFVRRLLVPVEENLQDMTDFVHNAGHELKTPLSVMRGNLQVMQVEGKYDKKLLKKSIREIDNTNSLIEGLIELSQIGKLSERLPLALAIEVWKAVNELWDLAENKKITINNSASGSFIVHTNKQALHILLMNIIKNAITHGKKWWEVNISLHKNILSISDNGIWISPKDREKIFERFYQWSTGRSGEWFGIGLSLVKKIADANNWKIEIESEDWKWSEFKIIF
jgi:signal transduction histidine kinase